MNDEWVSDLAIASHENSDHGVCLGLGQRFALEVLVGSKLASPRHTSLITDFYRLHANWESRAGIRRHVPIAPISEAGA